MSFKTLAAVAAKEQILAYVLASISNIVLLIPQWQLAARAGITVEIPVSVALYQVLIGVLLVLLAISGTIRKRWKWQYGMIGLLTAGYVGYRLSTKFVAGLEAVSRIASSGASVAGDVPTLYSYGLGAALAYTGMILVMRRSYNKLVTYKSIDRLT